MRRPSLFTLVTFAALSAVPLAAQNRPAAATNSCAAKGPKLPAAGSWAEYKVDSSAMRLAYLGKEAAGERVEMSMNRPASRRGPAGPMVIQMVVPGYPYEMADAKEVVMQSGSDAPMKLNEQMLGMMRSRMPSGSQINNETCARMTEVGKESVTVPAGTFQTTHYRDAQRGTDVWISPSVPFGMVRVVGEGRTVELQSSGTGAKSKITGTPQEMGPGGMMGAPSGSRPGH